MAMHKVRLTQRPDEEIEVDSSGYESLRLQGLLVVDDKALKAGEPQPPAPPLERSELDVHVKPVVRAAKADV